MKTAVVSANAEAAQGTIASTSAPGQSPPCTAPFTDVTVYVNNAGFVNDPFDIVFF